MKKYIILLACVLIQLCTGGLYAWSVFVPALTDEASYALTSAQTQLIFGALIAVFTLSMVFAGRLLERIAPRWIALFGGLCFGAGYILAGLSGGNFYLMLLGIGGVSGVGTGCCYVVVLALCTKWFPKHKGLATGIAVAGFGGGAVVLTYLAKELMSNDMDALAIFQIIGIAYIIIICAATIPMSMPKVEDAPTAIEADLDKPRFAYGQLLADWHFWMLVVGIFAGTFAGLLVIGNLKPMILAKVDLTGGSLTEAEIKEQLANIATYAISIFAVGNALGRTGWGWLADRIGGWTIPSSLIFLAAAIGLSYFIIPNEYGALAASALLGLGFGGCFIVYYAETASHYGADKIAKIYPLVFLAYGLSALIGPPMGGYIYDVTESFNGGLAISFVLLLIAAVVYFPMVKMKRQMPLRALAV